MINRDLRAQVIRGWESKDYTLLEEWVCKSDVAWWDHNRGRSWINGKIYPAYIIFDTKEDMSACKLKFPDIIRSYLKNED